MVNCRRMSWWKAYRNLTSLYIEKVYYCLVAEVWTRIPPSNIPVDSPMVKDEGNT